MYVLGIDIGTGGTRALIIDKSGKVVSSATEEHEPFASPQIGWAEQKPEDWWRATGIAVRKALGNAGLGGITFPQGNMGGMIGIILGGQFPQGGGTRRGGGGWGRGRGGNSGGRSDYATGKRYLEALAEQSGGREFEAGTLQNLDAAFSGIAEELRRQYSIGYYPENVGQIGDRKQIRIRVMKPNVVVRAKNSYIVGQTNRAVAGK